jgi:putative transposase
MARIARLVVPGLPHHLTRRGDRREPVFFEADDYRPYPRRAAAPAYQSGPVV